MNMDLTPEFIMYLKESLNTEDFWMNMPDFDFDEFIKNVMEAKRQIANGASVQQVLDETPKSGRSAYYDEPEERVLDRIDTLITRLEGEDEFKNARVTYTSEDEDK